MVEVIILGSGSRGNAALVRTADSAVLLDAGLSCRQIVLRLTEVGHDPDRLDAVLLTHEHGDHVRGLRHLRRRRPLPVFANPGTTAALDEKFDALYGGPVHCVATGERFEAGAFTVRSFTVPHDAADPVGYVLEAEGTGIGYATDLGYWGPGVIEALEGCPIVVVEANHDEHMLRGGPYPPVTKERIASQMGHLSNKQTFEYLDRLAGAGLRRMVCAHLSENNNTPGHVQRTGRQVCRSRSVNTVRIDIACQHRPLTGISIS